MHSGHLALTDVFLVFFRAPLYRPMLILTRLTGVIGLVV